MKCTIPEISWHNREPVLSIDFQVCDGNVRRLATGGTDAHVLMWTVTTESNGVVNVEFAADLRRHNKAVNVVRFSPCGTFLASGDDEAAIWLWKKVDKDPGDIFNEEEDKDNKEHWSAFRTLRGHVEDVCDLGWSPDSSSLISGSVDNTAILWDVHKGRNLRILSDHKGFVQGVAWDPKNQFVSTLCSDRVCRIYNVKTQRLVHKIIKSVIPVGSQKTASGEDLPARPVRLFHDDTLKTFCRRLTFSPDGEILITPCGILDIDNGKTLNTTYIFSRHCLNKPAVYLPSKDKYTVAVRCCPVLFKLRNEKQNTDCLPTAKPWEIYPTMIKLPYRIVIAVATQDSVFLYDTQQQMPFAQVSRIHYTRLTDLAWSKNGSILCVSSTDGYCSFIAFKENELGVPYEGEPKKCSTSPSEKTSSESGVSTTKEIPEVAVTTPNSKDPTDAATPVERSPSESSPLSCDKAKKKRVSLITLFSPKQALSAQKNCQDTAEGKAHRRTRLEYPEESPMDIESETVTAAGNVGVDKDLSLDENAKPKPTLDPSDDGIVPVDAGVVEEESEKKDVELTSKTSKISLTEGEKMEVTSDKTVMSSEHNEKSISLIPTAQPNEAVKDSSNTGSSPIVQKSNTRPPRRIQPILISTRKKLDN